MEILKEDDNVPGFPNNNSISAAEVDAATANPPHRYASARKASQMRSRSQRSSRGGMAIRTAPEATPRNTAKRTEAGTYNRTGFQRPRNQLRDSGKLRQKCKKMLGAKRPLATLPQ